MIQLATVYVDARFIALRVVRDFFGSGWIAKRYGLGPLAWVGLIVAGSCSLLYVFFWLSRSPA